MWKTIAIVIWVGVTTGFFYVMSLAFEADKSFLLFAILFFGGNFCYDILKELIKLKPLFSVSDWKRFSILGLVSLALFAASFVGILIDAMSWWPFHLGLVVWVVFYIAALLMVVELEKQYKLMANRA